jgi:hypothetical protein
MGMGGTSATIAMLYGKTTYGSWFLFPYLHTNEVLALGIEHID